MPVSAPRSRWHRLLLPGLATGLVLTLGACGGDAVSERITERAVEQAGGEGADVDIDSDSGEVRIETGEGTFTSGAGLPDGFPDDVPVIDGEILSGAATTESDRDAFIVLVQTDLSVDEAMDEASALLLDAGFEEGEDGAILGARQLTRGGDEVVFVAYDGGEGASVQYTVLLG